MAVNLSKEDSEMVRSMMWKSLMSLISQAEENAGENKRKNTFLTQFDEKDASYTRHLVAKPTTGMSSNQASHQLVAYDRKRDEPLAENCKMDAKLQRNMLARYHHESNVVTKNLFKKRQDFERRINACKEKQNQLLLKQQENAAVIKKYSQFINEKDAIRKRAIVKYQTELKTRLQKMVEYDLLLKQLEEISQVHQKIANKVEKNKKFKEFLAKVIELLPDNYLEAGDTKYNSLMLRHETLYETNLDLFESLMENSDKIKNLRNEYEKMIFEHNSNKMRINSKLGELIQTRESLQAKNARYEENLNQDADKKREQMMDLSRILWAIDNLAEKSIEKTKYETKPVDDMTLEEKLNAIKTCVNKKTDVIKSISK